MIKLHILEEKNVIHDHLLDIIGNEFKFDHEKGLSEWLKNSVDAYIREDVADNKQHVIIRFSDGVNNDASLECIDFVGMDENDIVKAFKRWGDPEAAKRGLKKRTYGGHGNGGKFYMRQMFSRSHFVTYKQGCLNIFGFNESRKYGFAKGFRNKKVGPRKALEIAGINKIVSPPEIKDKILDNRTGFTVVKGTGPQGMKNIIKAEKIIEKFKSHPQSRNLLSRINVSAIYNDKVIYTLLRPDEIKTMKGFEVPRVIPTPEKLDIKEGSEKHTIQLATQRYPAGQLTLMVSEMAFERNSRFGELNRIDFIGEMGVIASYRITELDVRNFPQAAFVYGECECPILEDPENDAVRNDRTKLVPNDITRALLEWTGEQIDQLAAEIAYNEEKEREKVKMEIASVCNDFLNKWKNRFMKKALSEILGAGVEGETGSVMAGRIKNVLEVPENLEFSFAMAKIPINERWPITLKVRVSESIPIGSVVFLSSDNSWIELEENELTVGSECIRDIKSGEKVGVLNAYVIGKCVGESGRVSARVGKFCAEIVVEVIESKGGKSVRKASYPRVLLSGKDSDPLGIAPGGKVILDPRQPLVYQRPQDIKERIYWINTSAPLAQAIIKKYGSHSLRWRDYLFQRYVEIFVKEALYELQRKDPDSFRAERIDSDILGILITKIHTNAIEELKEFLFKEDYELLFEKEAHT